MFLISKPSFLRWLAMPSNNGLHFLLRRARGLPPCCSCLQPNGPLLIRLWGVTRDISNKENSLENSLCVAVQHTATLPDCCFGFMVVLLFDLSADRLALWQQLWSPG